MGSLCGSLWGYTHPLDSPYLCTSLADVLAPKSLLRPLLHEPAGGWCRVGEITDRPEVGARISQAPHNPLSAAAELALHSLLETLWKLQPAHPQGLRPCPEQGCGSPSCIEHIGEPTRPTRRRLLDASILRYESASISSAAPTSCQWGSHLLQSPIWNRQLSRVVA
jgi:hypothetical protein